MSAPNFSFDSRSLRWSFRLSTRPASAPFQVGYGPIRQVMDSLCLAAAGLRFSGLLVPAGELGRPCGWLTGRSTTPRPHRGFHVPLCGDATGEDVPFTPEPWRPRHEILGSHGLRRGVRSPPRPDGSIRPCQPPLRSVLRDEASSGSSFQSSRCPFGPGDWTSLRLFLPGFARGRYRPRTLGWGWAHGR